MKRLLLSGTAATGICLGFAAFGYAAQPTGPADAIVLPAAATTVDACLAHVRSLATQMGKDGYWMGGSDYGYGYPVGGYGYGYGIGDGYPTMNGPKGGSANYLNARPGYEIRNLMVAANILAENGQEQPCETVLATTRDIYARYVGDLKDRKLAWGSGADWRVKQIAAAIPITSDAASARIGQLVDDDLRSLSDVALGTIHDLVLNPQTGKIAYLVVARGGLFGIDQKYVPVPWNDFKVTTNADLLVLDATKATMEAAPAVTESMFRKDGQFVEESQKVDAYWLAHPATKTGG